MKYIKLFENFFDFKFGSRLWVEADDWEKWQELVEKEIPEELESEEISEIIQTFKGNDVVNDSGLPSFIYSYSVVKRFYTDETENSCINITLTQNGAVIIYKFHDYKWMIEIFDDEGGHFEDAKFVCETYEGLINWIEDWREKIR